MARVLTQRTTPDPDMRSAPTSRLHSLAAPRYAAVGLLWLAAGIHVSLIAEHFDERIVYGVFFVAASMVQVALGALLLRRADRRAVQLGAITSLGLVATWLVTRAVVPPLSPEGRPEAVTVLGVVATAAELATLMVLLAMYPPRARRSPWVARCWGLAAGVGFASLFLLASNAVSYIGENGPAPSLHTAATTGIFQSPLVYGRLLPHVWLVGSLWTLLFLVDAAALLGLVVAATLQRSACSTTSGRTAAGLLPAFLGVSGCCGAPLAAAFGVSAVSLLLRLTPWLLLATILVLTINLRIVKS